MASVMISLFANKNLIYDIILLNAEMPIFDSE